MRLVFTPIANPHWRKAMRTLMLAGAAALVIATVPAALGAQSQAPEAAPTVTQSAASVEPVPETANQANADAPPLPTTEEVIPGDTPSEPDRLVTTHHGNMQPPPATALNKTYPVCTRDLQDDCRNRGEGDDTALGG
jgi:hypothetical protein